MNFALCVVFGIVGGAVEVLHNMGDGIGNTDLEAVLAFCYVALFVAFDTGVQAVGYGVGRRLSSVFAKYASTSACVMPSAYMLQADVATRSSPSAWFTFLVSSAGLKITSRISPVEPERSLRQGSYAVFKDSRLKAGTNLSFE